MNDKLIVKITRCSTDQQRVNLFVVEETEQPDEVLIKIRIKHKYYDLLDKKAHATKANIYDLFNNAIKRSANAAKSYLETY